MPAHHVAVLEPELIALLDPQPGETVVDATFGFGGHARAVAERLGRNGELICIDRDPAAGLRWREISGELDSPSRFIRADFADALEGLASQGAAPDAIYLDLGVSSMQLDAAERGFSYSFDAPLDMRMDPTTGPSALQAVNEWTEERLAEVLRDYGEERHSRAIAREVVRRRPMATTGELVEAIRDAVPAAYRFGRGHPAKRSFQALRIAVNDELGALDRALPAAWGQLPIGGRLAVICFHSLEDRRVKRFLGERARPCICPPELPECRCGGRPEAESLARRAVAPSEQEVERNPRARSAHLRAARKLTGERA
ncbi:MAG: 16S rRNA (cytosine(1402)-N(4))-methyltransferase RsmH [Solirubrobacterales bacterium]|nr:16S rRNA (cytosine(1402)-N(4))-methyltransferase RsmH [Solirubrobacterales bacterium]